MRISDWSSDVCSSDLHGPCFRRRRSARERAARPVRRRRGGACADKAGGGQPLVAVGANDAGKGCLRLLPVRASGGPLPASACRQWGAQLCGTCRSGRAGGRGPHQDRKSVVSGKGGAVRVNLGGRRIINKTIKTTTR